MMARRSDLVVFLLLLPHIAAAQTVTCPPVLTVKSVAHRFEHISVFNGKSGGEEYELAPDDETKAGTRLTQIWKLTEYRSLPMFLRCRYQGAKEVINLDLPEPLKTCSFKFNIDARGRISGPFEMECR